MKKFLLTTLLLMTAMLFGCGNDENSDKAVLVVGLDDEYAPFGFRDENSQIVGFDVDVAKEVAKRMGVKFEFKPINWSNKREEITSGKVDIIWNGCDITDERKEYLIYSKPYMDNRQILLVRQGTYQDIRTEGDLEGKIVGTQAGSTSENHVNDTPAFKNSFKEFKVYHNFKDAFNALDKGEVDVLICDEIVGRYGAVRFAGKFDVLEVTVGTPCEIGIAFRKDEVELRDRVQKIFDDMIKDGTAAKISEKWFQADLIKHVK